MTQIVSPVRPGRRAGCRSVRPFTQTRFTGAIDGVVTVNEELVADDERLDDLLRESTFSRGALMGGARTGPDGEPDAVVDAHCRVRGVANLRVVDLSVISVRLRFTSTLGVMLLGKTHRRVDRRGSLTPCRDGPVGPGGLCRISWSVLGEGASLAP